MKECFLAALVMVGMLRLESTEIADYFLKSFVIWSYLMSFLLTAELSLGHKHLDDPNKPGNLKVWISIQVGYIQASIRQHI